MVDREVIRNAVQRVLWNASNYPRRVQPHLLGQDIAPLTAVVTDAVMFALLTESTVPESAPGDSATDQAGTTGTDNQPIRSE